ncbi:hypothetical protein Kisp02_60780 [Kineosporia sp. NBRC 101731]|nr:hypothetical protein Kisp02_60780 [Kineosporia sp. NBRC 101731]
MAQVPPGQMIFGVAVSNHANRFCLSWGSGDPIKGGRARPLCGGPTGPSERTGASRTTRSAQLLGPARDHRGRGTWDMATPHPLFVIMQNLPGVLELCGRQF